MELTTEQKVFQTIVYKCWEDPAFKKALIANPIHTIESITNVTIRIPEGKTLMVCDQTDESFVYINIPVRQAIDDLELTEEQLEIVAGGGDPGAVIQNPANALKGIIEG